MTTFTDDEWHDCESCGERQPHTVNRVCHGLLVCNECACVCAECMNEWLVDD